MDKEKNVKPQDVKEDTAGKSSEDSISLEEMDNVSGGAVPQGHRPVGR